MDLSNLSMPAANTNDSTPHTKMLASPSPAFRGIGVSPPSSAPPLRVLAASDNPASSSVTDSGPSQILFGARGQVMTDEQMETLRRQISVYATICQQLVELHKATVAQQNAMAGSRYGQSSLDPNFHGMGQKFASRQRWTPSQTQLQILERLFQQGNGTPSKQRIKEISQELSQYGQISETNVYNWFQNRRARTKRRQQTGAANNGESEFDTDVDSQDEKRTRMDRDVSHDSLGTGHYETDSHNWEINTEHKPSENMSKGLQPSQSLPVVDDVTTAFSKSDADGHASASLNGSLWEIAAAAHEGKPEHVAASTLQGCQTIVTINGEPFQNYKNVAE